MGTYGHTKQTCAPSHPELGSQVASGQVSTDMSDQPGIPGVVCFVLFCLVSLFLKLNFAFIIFCNCKQSELNVCLRHVPRVKVPTSPELIQMQHILSASCALIEVAMYFWLSDMSNTKTDSKSLALHISRGDLCGRP